MSLAVLGESSYRRGVRTVQSRFKVVLAEKELRENRSIRLGNVVEETDVSNSTVLRLANNTIKRVPLDELAKLCAYLDCAVGDLLWLEQTPEVAA